MRTFAPPRDGATQGRLVLSRGRKLLTVRATEIDELCRAEFTGIAPRASNVRLLLPTPRSGVHVRIGGGASGVTVLRPPGILAVLQVGGGVTRLTFDGDRYGAIADFTRLESDDRDRQPGHYEIEILGGASDLTIAEESPWHA